MLGVALPEIYRQVHPLAVLLLYLIPARSINKNMHTALKCNHSGNIKGNIGDKLAQQSKNEIIKQTLTIWSKMVKEYNMDGDIKLLTWPALDPRFEPGIGDSGFRQWWDRGITAMCTMTHRGLLKRFSELQKEFGLENKDFFRYLQIRDFYNKSIKPTLSREGNTEIDTDWSL